MFSSISDIVIALAASITAVVAIRSLNAWRSEMKGHVEFDVSRNILRACFGVREAFWHVRNPLSYIPRESSMSKQGRATHEMDKFQERWKVLAKAMQEFEVQLVEAEIIWGPILTNQMIEIRKCVGNLQMSIQEYVESLESANDNLSNEDWKKLRKDLYAVRNSTDPLSEEMRKAILGFERVVRDRMQR